MEHSACISAFKQRISREYNVQPILYNYRLFCVLIVNRIKERRYLAPWNRPTQSIFVVQWTQNASRRLNTGQRHSQIGVFHVRMRHLPSTLYKQARNACLGKIVVLSASVSVIDFPLVLLTHFTLQHQRPAAIAASLAAVSLRVVRLLLLISFAGAINLARGNRDGNRRLVGRRRWSSSPFSVEVVGLWSEPFPGPFRELALGRCRLQTVLSLLWSALPGKSITRSGRRWWYTDSETCRASSWWEYCHSPMQMYC